MMTHAWFQRMIAHCFCQSFGKCLLAILGAKMSTGATKVLTRIEALRGATKAGVLSSEEAGTALSVHEVH